MSGRISDCHSEGRSGFESRLPHEKLALDEEIVTQYTTIVAGRIVSLRCLSEPVIGFYLQNYKSLNICHVAF